MKRRSGTQPAGSSSRSGTHSTTSRPTRGSTDSSRPGIRPEPARWTDTSSTRQSGLREALESAMTRYDFGTAYDAIETFIETLSGWYLRLSRSKAWASGDSPAKTACYETLHLSLDATARLLAPFMPFVADALYQALGAGRSVHLADWPRACPEWVDNDLAAEMRSLRKIVTLARSVRERLGIRHRHPLPVLYIGGAGEQPHRSSCRSARAGGQRQAGRGVDGSGTIRQDRDQAEHAQRSASA